MVRLGVACCVLQNPPLFAQEEKRWFLCNFFLFLKLVFKTPFNKICLFLFEKRFCVLKMRVVRIGAGLQDGLVLPRRFVAEVPPPGDLTVDNSSFILAAARTHRKDPLNGFKRYTGGWNISEKHYWAVSPLASLIPVLLQLLNGYWILYLLCFWWQSVGFTAAPLFAIALVWFLGFGLASLLICCCYFCCRRRTDSYSRTAYALSLILLMLSEHLGD